MRRVLVQRAVQRLAEPLRVRFAHDADRNGVRPVSVRRSSLVQHALRAGRNHHRAGGSLDEPRAGEWRPLFPRGDPGAGAEFRPRRGAREDHPRDAPRRNGGVGRGAVPPLLRKRGRDAALRNARGSLRQEHRGSRPDPPHLAEHRARARVDGEVRGPGSGRPRRVLPPFAERTGQSGMEGFR